MSYVKIVLGTIAAFSCLLGSIWMLQGVNILPGSFMTGDIRWTYRGAAVVIAGVAVLFWTLRTPGVWRGVVCNVGVLFGLLGILFALQGSNVLRGSAMSGDMRWTYRGAVMVVIGVALLVIASRKPKVAAK